MIPTQTPLIDPAAAPWEREGAVDEGMWLDVIQRMDAVYSQLVQDEIELEAKNERLQASQQFIVSLLSSMSDVLLAVDAAGRVEQTNTALHELVGRRAEQIEGQPVQALLARERDAQRLEQVFQALGQASLDDTPGSAPRPSVALEIHLLDAAGGEVPVDLRCTPRTTPQGGQPGFVLVGRPLGDLQQAYAQLRQAHEALQRTQQQLLQAEKMASLGRLVAGVAHELNNPISFVLGNVDALQRYHRRLGDYVRAMHSGAAAAELDALRTQWRIDHVLDDLPDLTEGLVEGADRTADIVQGLKRFSAVQPSQRCVIDVRPVIEQAAQWVSKAESSHFQIRLELGDEPLWAEANDGQLLQVALNLIQNAHDSACGVTPDEIERSRARAVPPALLIRSHRDGAEVVLDFQDNGPGIPNDHLPRIFDPFFTTKPVGKGTGLGLSISYGLLEQNGGRLIAGNGPDGGACLSIRLPAVAERTA
ncbi:ATP-binding protein [Amphibiibacter pelophylacis]|uniref:Histidine kinase dimerization/phospho-acceptor domain-containing protein n=1 Tax=Amphibiibacter pelophylacis TaxID=1799477 RepID=A0ACC6P039_9BURK